MMVDNNYPFYSFFLRIFVAKSSISEKNFTSIIQFSSYYD